MTIKIWVDADATPRPVKEILFKAADRVKIELILVANQALFTTRSRWVSSVIVGRGFDVADEYIADKVETGDLVITADVPLAATAVEKGAVVIGPRGDVTDATNARQRLAARDRNEERRLSGEMLGGPKPYSDRDKRKFAGSLDRWLAKRPIP
jgi:uncharacterized protein YaiI (UPF0178 family)